MHRFIQVSAAAFFISASFFMTSASADCDCGRTDPADPCTGSSVTRMIGGNAFTWTFNAGGEACRCGRFVNGDYWVVPVTASGRRVDAVTVTDITPDAGGAMADPVLSNTHGLLPKWPNYDSTLNIMRQLPYAAQPGQSLIKAASKDSGCLGYGPRLYGECSGALDILTVLDSVPPGNGSTVFRPAYAGRDKPLRSISNVRWERLPRIPEISDHASQESFSAIATQWSAPTLDIIRGGAVEIYRALAPIDVYQGRDYAADIAAKYLNKLLSVFGTEPLDSSKKAAVYALMQPGLDNFEAYNAGFKFNSGAGQHLGKKPEIVFAAAMYDDPDMMDAIRGASVKADEGWFQEDKQVFTSENSVTPVWGDWNDAAFGDDDQYWLRFGYDANDNTKSMCDPYGYVDGPAHGIHGSSYQEVTSGPYMSFALAQHLMPWMKYADNDREILEYIDRLWDGRGIDGFDGGWWGAPDPCAAKTDSTVRGVDYGENPDHPGDCIKDGIGRFVADHGTIRGFGRKSWITETVWPLYRDCADPDNPSYPCAGLGARIDSSSFITDIRTDASKLPVRISPAPVTAHARLRLPVAAGSPVRITDSRGKPIATLTPEQDNRLYFWDSRNAIPGLYVYSFEYRGSTYSGKFIKAE